MKLRLLVVLIMTCTSLAVAQGLQPKIYGALTPGDQETGSGGYFSINADGTGYSVKEFDAHSITGIMPQGEIMTGADGRLYGTASAGGDFKQGVLFSFKEDGSDYKVVHHFGSVATDGAIPMGNLVQIPNGEIFGVTFSGGSNMRGIIYKVKPDGTGYQVVKHFANLEGESPRDGLILASNGKLYGTTSTGTPGTSGGVYTINQDGTGYTILHSFNSGGGIPFAGVIQASDGVLYGTTLLDAGSNPKQGTIFKLNLDGTGYTEFYLFASSDGTNPLSGVIEGLDGNLYGLCYGDGPTQHSIVYKINKNGTGFGVIHTFTNDLATQSVELVQTPDGFLFGMGQTTLFKLKPDGSSFQSLATFDGTIGSLPAASLTLINNNLWGTLSQGAIPGFGSIIKVTPEGIVTAPLVFGPHPELGSVPLGSPIRSATGGLIGIANYGGAHSKGILYRMDESLNYTKILDLPEVPLHNGPYNHDLVQAPDHSLLGIGYAGNMGDLGFIFSVQPDGSQFKVVHEFDFIHGYASGPIIMGTDGFVYGTSSEGGALNHGMIYKMKPDGSGYTDVHDFDADIKGAYPYSIMMASNGVLYGVTGQAGGNNSGTIFRLNPDGTDYQVMYQQAEIYGIQFALTEFDEVLYGISLGGGANGIGTLFAINLDGSGLSILHDFNIQDGAVPSGKLAIDSNGTIYGTNTEYGANNHGTFYSMKTDGSQFNVHHDFVYGKPGFSPLVIEIKQDQTITFDPLPDKIAADVPFQLTAAASSGLSITYMSDNTNVAIINGNTVTIAGAGKASITASQAGDNNFTAATNVVRELIVDKAGQSITFAPLSNKIMFDQPFTLAASSSSGLPVSYSSDNPNVATVNGTSVTIVGVGKAIITASQDGNANFLPATKIDQPLTVSKKGQSISFAALPSKTISDTLFQLTATTASGLPVTYSSDNLAVATVSGNTVTIVGAGKASITASQDGDNNYLPAQVVVRDLIVNKNSQTITFDPLSQRPEGSFTLTARSSSGLPVTFTSDNNIISITGSTATLKGAGSVTITAIQAGDANYEAASPVSQKLDIVITAVEDVAPLMISAYPNPSHGIVNLYGPGLDDDHELQVIVTGASGNIQQVMQPLHVSKNNFQFDISDLTPGLYIVRIKGSAQAFKIVKQ